jgi:hypothetical protein
MRRAPRALALVGMSTLLAAVALPSGPGASAAPVAASIDIRAVDGTGRIDAPGRACAAGGTGGSWHYDYGADLVNGAFSALASQARVHLDLHSDTQNPPNVGGVYPTGANPAGFLLAEESHAVLANERGTVTLRLTSGSCTIPTLQMDGSTFSGSGDWRADGGTGAYRAITGLGTFDAAGGVDPGADNGLNLDLRGTFTILQPALRVEFVKSYWGGLGTDYLTRRPTVIYRITNIGTGDAFGARLRGVTSPTTGVTVLGPTTAALIALAAGESTLVPVRYQLGLVGPCALVLLACTFSTSLTVDLPDALDIAHVASKTVSVRAPNLPPPA